MSAIALPAASLVGLALLLGWLASVSTRGELERQGAIGIRTRATMRSDASWTAGHRAASGRVWAAAWVAVVGAAIGLGLTSTSTALAGVAVAATYVSVVGLLVAASIRAGRAARATEA